MDRAFCLSWGKLARPTPFLLRLLQLRCSEFVVRDLVHPVLQVVGAAIAEIEIVAVLPYVAAKQSLAFASRGRIGAIRRLGDLQFAIAAKHQPAPTGAELRGPGVLEGIFELRDATQV